MNFTNWLKRKDNTSDIKKKVEELINNYNKDYKLGFGVVKQEEELAALLYAAKNNFPPNTKHNAIVNDVNLPELFTPNTTQNEMWKMLKQLNVPVMKLDDGKRHPSYVIGKDAALLKKVIQDMRAAKDNAEDPDSEEYNKISQPFHKQIGKLLGYTDKSIQAFIDRSSKMNRKEPVPDVHDEDFIKSVREHLSFASWLAESEEDHGLALRQTGFWGRQGAGAIIIAKDTGKILLPHRSFRVQEPDTWGTWGGAIDSNENPETAAKREVEEEAGYSGHIEMIPLAVFTKNTFKYYNFAALVENEFVPKLNWETQGYKWVEFGDWPSPLHPGLQWLISTDGNKIQDIIQSQTVEQ